MKKRYALVAFALLLPAAVFSQPLVAFGEGAVAFDFSQFPFGPYSGSMNADGPAGGSAEFFEPGENQGCGGITGSASSGHVFAGYGAFRNPDTSVDVVILYVFDETDPIAPGTYGIDLTNLSCLFWFLDDVTEIDIPANFAEADWDDVLVSVVAAHKFGSISGDITIEAMDGTGISGAFSGTMSDLSDPLLIISASNGTFDFGEGIVPMTESSLGELKALFR